MKEFSLSKTITLMAIYHIDLQLKFKKVELQLHPLRHSGFFLQEQTHKNNLGLTSFPPSLEELELFPKHMPALSQPKRENVVLHFTFLRKKKKQRVMHHAEAPCRCSSC